MCGGQIEAILSLDNATRNKSLGVYAMDRLPKRNPRAYVINTDDQCEAGSNLITV